MAVHLERRLHRRLAQIGSIFDAESPPGSECRPGRFLLTVMAATGICVVARSRSSRDWSDLVASDSGRFRAGGLLGCWRRALCGLPSPSVWFDFGSVQTVLPELGPGSSASGAIWSRWEVGPLMLFIDQCRIMGGIFGLW